jgi:outer membrane lipoprotein-sorting protein
MKKARIFAPMALALAVSPLLAACGAGTGAQPATAADVVQQVRDASKNITSMQGMVDLSLTINKDGIKTLPAGIMPGMGSNTDLSSNDPMAKLPDKVDVSLKYWKDTPDKMRVEVVSSSIPEAKGAVLVYDGQKVYALDAVNNTVYSATPGKFQDKMPDQMKAMLAGLDMDKEIDKMLAATDITLGANEKVAGVDTYKLEVAPKADAATLLGLPKQFAMQAGVLIKDLRGTVWVDQSRSVPVKMTVEHPNIGSFTYTANALDVNKAIDAATFVLQVPAGAKVVDLDAKADQAQPKQVTLPDARDYAKSEGWTLLEPSYTPAGSTVVGVTRMGESMGGAVQISYSSKGTDFSLTEANAGKRGTAMLDKLVGLGDGYSGLNDPTNQATQEVTVRGVTAKAFSPAGGNWTSLIWQEKASGLFVAIRGNLSVDEAVKIAEGLK